MSFYGKKRHFVGTYIFFFKLLEVDKGNIEVIGKMPHPSSIKGVESFLEHVGLFVRFFSNL